MRGEGTHGLSPTPRNASSTPFMVAVAAESAGPAAAAAGTLADAGKQKQAGNGSGSSHSLLKLVLLSCQLSSASFCLFIAD